MNNWIIEKGIENEANTRLINSAIAAGSKVYSPDFIPFRGLEIEDSVEKISSDFWDVDNIFFHGSIQACNWLNTHKSEGNPIKVFKNTEQFNCSYYYSVLGDICINSDCLFIPYGMIEQNKELLFDKFGIQDTIFIRPNSGDKVFTGQTLSVNTWDSDFKLLSAYGVELEEWCVVTYPMSIKEEARFIVSDGNLITGSVYVPYNMEVQKGSGMWGLGQIILNRINSKGYNPDKIWAMDVCWGISGAMYLLEAGAFSACGLYKCNTDLIVKHVNSL